MSRWDWRELGLVVGGVLAALLLGLGLVAGYVWAVLNL